MSDTVGVIAQELAAVAAIAAGVEVPFGRIEFYNTRFGRFHISSLAIRALRLQLDARFYDLERIASQPHANDRR